MYSGSMKINREKQVMSQIPPQMQRPQLTRFEVNGKPRYVPTRDIGGAWHHNGDLVIEVESGQRNSVVISDAKEIEAAYRVLDLLSAYVIEQEL